MCKLVFFTTLRKNYYIALYSYSISIDRCTISIGCGHHFLETPVSGISQIPNPHILPSISIRCYKDVFVSLSDSNSGSYSRSNSLVAKTELEREKINSRERQRMHQLNRALDELRSVLPQTPGVCKLSKMSTLQAAR